MVPKIVFHLFIQIYAVPRKKSLFKSKRNVIIGEIYRPPSSNKNILNTEN